MKLSKYKEIYRSELFDYVLPFWLKNSPDSVNGGIYNCLDEQGKVYSTDKSVWAQGRAAWVFSFLSNIYGKKPEWLDLAESCLSFLEKYCIDRADGRMYFTVSGEGKPLRKRRYLFSETFYIIANAEYALVTGKKEYLVRAKEYYDFVWSIYKDPSKDPFSIHPKTFGETRTTSALSLPMILLNVTSVMRRCDPENNEIYNLRSAELIHTISTKFVKNDIKAVLETTGANGEFMAEIADGRILNPGHAIECSWFVLSELPFSNKDLLKQAEDMFNWSIERGWDKKYGGILYFVDVFNHPPEHYEHDMKLWWPHLEALIASLMLYKQTGKNQYIKWFKKIHKYAFKYLSDHNHGDWYGYLRRDGKPTLPACKGNTYKSGFHLLRALSMVERLLSEC